MEADSKIRWLISCTVAVTLKVELRYNLKIDEDFQSALPCSPKQLIESEFYPMYGGKMALSAGRTLWAMRYINQLLLIYSYA